MQVITLSLILFLIMDPIGHIKAFIKTLEGIAPKRQQAIVRREMAIALGFMVFFNFVGEGIFNLLQISDVTVYMASGIILFLVAIKILFPSNDREEMQVPPGEPFIVPLAIPRIAGPALIATIMLCAHSEPNLWTSLFAILLAWVVSSLILLNAKSILKIVGSGGLTACEKLMGMVLVLLSVQRFLQGVLLLSKVGSAG